MESPSNQKLVADSYIATWKAGTGDEVSPSIGKIFYKAKKKAECLTDDVYCWKV